ncbi:MAG: bifunctional riboflavin kinase/FAD synthetase [Gemmatimonadota bacterium]|jgi:riboflavin kinase/FMN adenylyltransferase|nr:bifunctional riboflavin kinase/FAD synthetase [Gemmatimonadota bacterium]
MREGIEGWSAPFAIDPALPAPFPRDGRGSVVTVGTFDGVHRGHQEVLAEIVRRARRTGRRSVLVTFHPHPLRVVRPEAAPPALTTPAEKREILAQSGVEYAVFLPFTPVLQHYPARRFVEEILLGRLDLRELVIGYDHGFGRDREGGVDTMREIGGEAGFDVDVVEAVRAGESAVSSTRIRRALAEGDVAEAARGLGRPYSVTGPVIHGAQRGRKLGFPTANIRVEDPYKMLPREGVYAVHGWVAGGRVPGLLHLGPRPTFQGSPPSIELHLLDWSGDLYGRAVRVDFARWLRPIRPFASAGALVEQMKRDEAAARTLPPAEER